MASNDKLVHERYNSTAEDGRAGKSRANGLEFHYTKKAISEYIKKDSRVIEIGCATGYYGMYLADKCKEYVGVDLTPENIELFNTKIKNAGFKNVSAQVGDATDLVNIADESFDVVLCLGPMYHLPPEERELIFDECKRICKIGGIIVFAYINKAGAYLKGVLIAPDRYPNKKANEFILEKAVDDINPNLFFYNMPEEIASRARAHRLTVLKNIGVNFALQDKLINNMSDEQFEAWMELNDFLCRFESCTGLSIHALLICRKENIRLYR
jgi:ubiquinone/menaquinone biosynthesis C-methylase UbiE